MHNRSRRSYESSLAANLKEIDISFSVATGYGRVLIGYGNEDITEITESAVKPTN